MNAAGSGTSSTARASIRSFVGALYEPDDVIEVRLIRKSTEETKHKWITASDLPRLSIGQLNDQGFDIYIGACPRKAHGTPGVSAKDCTPERPCGKCDRCVVICRSLFADFDGITSEEVMRIIDEATLPPPTAEVDSGHGCHVYWRLAEPLTDMGLFTQYQRAIIAVVHSDPVIHNPSRIMRLVGTMNVKGKPVGCQLIGIYPERIFALDDFPKPETRSISPPTPNGSVDKDERANALRYLGLLKAERAGPRKDWIEVGMSLHWVDQGESMLAAWDQWSKQGDSWEDGACSVQWDTFQAGGGLTIRSLHRWAIEDSPVDAAKIGQGQAIVVRPEPEVRPIQPGTGSDDPYASYQEAMGAINKMAEASRQHKSMLLTLAVLIAEWKMRRGPEVLFEKIEHPIPYVAAALEISVSYFHKLDQMGRVLRCLTLRDNDVKLSKRAILAFSRLLEDHSEDIPKALETARKLAKADADREGRPKARPVRPKHVEAAVAKIIGPAPKRTHVLSRQSDVGPHTTACVEIRKQIAALADAIVDVPTVPNDIRDWIEKMGKHAWCKP